MHSRNGWKFEDKNDGFEIYSHPSPFHGERWFSICDENGGEVVRDIRSFSDAQEDLLMCVDERDSGDDEILGAIGADDSSVTVNKAINKEYAEVLGGVRHQRHVSMADNSPTGTRMIMENLRLDVSGVKKGFGADMDYVKKVSDTNSAHFRSMIGR